MAGALDMSLEDAVAANPPEGSALSAPKQEIDPQDVEARNQIFNNATQRLLQQRNAMGTPYGGANLGNIAGIAGALKGFSGPAAAGVSGMLEGRAQGAEVQRQANIQNIAQRNALDTRAEMAKILGQKGGGSLADAASLGAIGGDKEGSDALSKLILYDTRAQGAGGANMQAFKMLRSAYPTLPDATIWSMVKSGLGQTLTLDENNKVVNMAGAPAAAKESKKAEAEGGVEGRGEITPKEQLAKGKNQTSLVLSDLKAKYDALNAAGGMVNPEHDALTNIGAFGKSSAIGQYVGRALGTEEQSLRNEIEQMEPLVINAMRQATGMSAKAMDSNAELKFYRAAVKTHDYVAQKDALTRLDKMYGLGLGFADDSGQQQGNQPQGQQNQPPEGAKPGKDAQGNPGYFVPDPKRPGKYLQWQP